MGSALFAMPLGSKIFMNRSISITEHVKSLTRNYEVFVEFFPKVYLAAEYINDIFDQIYTERYLINENILWEAAVSKMLFGMHLSWVESFYLTIAGQQDVGFMAERKAIEFSCYISKVVNNHRRAEAWFNHLKDVKNLKIFSNEFKIPSCYLTNKYEHLIPLLVHYEFTSNFAVHANVNSLVTKWIESDEDLSTMSFQDLPDWIPPAGMISVRMGSFLLDSIIFVLKNKIKDYDDFMLKVKERDNLLIDAQVEVYKFSQNKYPNPFILKQIQENNMDGILSLFEDIKKKYPKSTA